MNGLRPLHTVAFGSTSVKAQDYLVCGCRRIESSSPPVAFRSPKRKPGELKARRVFLFWLRKATGLELSSASDRGSEWSDNGQRRRTRFTSDAEIRQASFVGYSSSLQVTYRSYDNGGSYLRLVRLAHPCGGRLSANFRRPPGNPVRRHQRGRLRAQFRCAERLLARRTWPSQRQPQIQQCAYNYLPCHVFAST